MTPTSLEREWLHGVHLPLEEIQTLATQFACIERLLGSQWIDDYVAGWGEFDRGGRSLHTLRQVARLGELLSLAESSERFRRAIVKRLVSTPDNLSSVWSELLGAEPFLTAGLKLEWEPSVRVGAKERKPDFAVIDNGLRTLVEVTRPAQSKEQRAAKQFLDQLGHKAAAIPAGWRCSAVFRRLPNAAEQAEFEAELASVSALAYHGIVVPPCVLANVAYVELAPPYRSSTDSEILSEGARAFTKGFGPLLFMQHWSAPVVSLMSIPRSLVVAVATRDPRLYSKLDEELEQVPETEPSLVIVDTSQTLGVAEFWPTELQSHFDEDTHGDFGPRRKPSAVWFLGESITPEGLVRLTTPTLVRNGGGLELPSKVSRVIEAWSAPTPHGRYQPTPPALLTSIRGEVS